MSRRNQAIRDRRTRATIWVVILAVIALIIACRHPFIWKQESKIAPGVPIGLEAVSDFLIVIDESTFDPSPKSFSDMSFSLAWLNTFQQEIGPTSLWSAPRFAEADLGSTRVIVLTQSVSRHDDWTPKIRGFLERGGVVVMEMPQGDLRGLASPDGKGGLRTPQSFTFAQGLPQDLMAALSDLNLADMTQIVGSAGPLDDAQTWLTIDGVPVITSKKYGAGRVITVDFNYGMILTALQQGRPLDDFSIRNVRASSLIETEDLARTGDTSLPRADVLERFLVHGVINDAMPVVGFWPFFDGMSGALIVSHHEQGAGDVALWMPQFESTFKATSTIFVNAPMAITDDGLHQLEKFQTEVGHAFTLDAPGTSMEPLGWFKYSPVWRQFSLDQQAQTMRDLLDSNAMPVSSQSRDGLWSAHYTHAFQRIAAAGFRADASYRAPEDAPGYAFATGLPFIPLDTNGLVFNLVEYPVVFPKLETDDQLQKLTALLKDSESRSHEAIGVSFDALSYPQKPDFKKFQIWRDAYQIATHHKHWITSILNFMRFSRARVTAELKSRSVEMRVANKPSVILRLEILAPEAGMSITVPKFHQTRAFAEARRGVQRVREDIVLADPIAATPVSLGGFDRILIPLTRGFNAIDVIYE